jgi:hypothetical protein
MIAALVVRGGFFRVVNHQDFDWFFARFQLQTEIVFEGSGQGLWN